ncbi:MAG: hypothetical protein LBM25_06955 [Bacteroidales bacterium]|jgi:hypothetical protein|nr:hypothetical protein [Bacteroidales bacterium]
MKKGLLFVFILVLFIGLGVDAQQKSNKKSKTKKSSKKVEVTEIPLPERCSDCFFAAPLYVDVPFGPTEPPRGYGFVSEISRNSATQNVFEAEHNSVWYIVTVPYNGSLCIDITPKAASDDYDFLVYKYTNKYFCNRIEDNKILPIRSVLSMGNTEQKGKTGLNTKSTLLHIPKSSNVAYGRSIDVLEGEKYVIVLDNLTSTGLGHTILVTISTDFAPLSIIPVDSITNERTTANLLVKDVETKNVILEKNDVGAQKIKILPNKEYEISLKKDGYFNYFKDVDHKDALKDSILRARLVEIKKGANLPILGELYFDVDEKNVVSLLPESYPALNEAVKTLQEYPQLSIEIIGRIPTEGLNLKKDVENSLFKAEAIRNYFIGRGISETNIRARGSSIKELEKQLADQKKSRSGKLITPNCEIRILKTK